MPRSSQTCRGGRQSLADRRVEPEHPERHAAKLFTTGPLKYHPGHWMLAAITATLSACVTLGPDYQRPDTELERTWSTTDVPDQIAQVGASEDFWSGFNDPLLIRLIALADEQSLDLKFSEQQVVQAREQLRITQGNSLPAAQLAGGPSYTQPDIKSRVLDTNEGATTHQLLGELSWEIDFWGKQRRARESSRANLAASEAALAEARVSLQASVASAYCNIRELQQRIVVAEANLAEQAENQRIAHVRFQYGETSELDWRQAETQYRQTLAQIPDLRIALAQYQHALSVLLGKPPDYFAHEFQGKSGRGLPAVPGNLALGAPRDLLRRRPDVRQAELAAAAQSARIGQAETALYPTFSLTGSFGYVQLGSADGLFNWDNRAITGAAPFYFPLFDRGTLVAQVQIQDSLFKQAILQYQNQVLTAQQEVEDALAQIKGNGAQVDELRSANDAAVRSTELSRVQFVAGQTNYTTVSSAELARLQLSDALVQAQGNLLQAYISAYRALGGGWDGQTTAGRGAEP